MFDSDGFRGLRVRLRSNHCCVLAVLVAALGLAGCAAVDVDNQQAWFAKKLDFSGEKGGYTFSE
ncbi:MAG: hypothetical protein WBD53_07940, partial [Xanthobacteraceae bacterium]